MSHGRKISVIGLGYVGLPVAVAFGAAERVVAFDIDAGRVAELQAGHDRTGEVVELALASADLLLTTKAEHLSQADFHIVTVPTPIDASKKPDLSALLNASRAVGRILKPGDIVVYESTVYPGATEEDCVPVLERESGLTFGKDFSVGYSPERINPGDREHRFETITKVVSGSDEATLKTVAAVYGSVVKAGVYRAPDIKTAEAAKVIENTQRDLNIALMNELSIICRRLDIDTLDVLEAARTKWNFLPFVPGLVGGHCIGVDPYYLTHRAEMLGYTPEVILAGRRINDGMGGFISRELIKALGRADRDLSTSVVTVLGATFKENVPDVRNSRVADIVRELESYGSSVQVVDPIADSEALKAESGLVLTGIDEARPAAAVVLCVAHSMFVERGWSLIESLVDGDDSVVVDIKGALDRGSVPAGISLWRL